MSAVARAIFLVPPFPGARAHDVIGSAIDAAVKPVSAAELIAAFRDHRVGGAFWLTTAASPWNSPADKAWTGAADDAGALLAAIAGRALELDGDGPFSGLSGRSAGTVTTEALLAHLVEAHLLDGLRYQDPFTGAPTSPLALITIFAAWRRLIDGNRSIRAAFGFAHWKRDTVDPLLWGGAPVSFRTARESSLADLPADAAIAVWKARIPATFLAELEAGPWRIIEVEDGFIRSAGLGANCVPPLSIVVDNLGVHYDPARPNRLETMLASHEFSNDDLARAARLRAWLVREGVSKYGVGAGTALARAVPDRRHILVVGQVEDDRSVQFGASVVRTNLELLRAVRAAEPDAYLIYRPHPDVESGHRSGAIPPETTREYADRIDAESPISALIALVDEVHVLTSLAGFEALLHGKAVTTHGTPFFAGWGLTRDLAPVPSRRNVARTMDELTAAILLRYPRYLDPVTNLPCTAEILVMRLLAGVHRQNVALVPMRRMVGWTKRAAAQILGMR